MINRTVPPRVKNISHIPFRHPERKKCKNGVELFSIQDQSDQTVEVNLFFDAGSNRTKKIIASLTTSLLLSGTTTRTSEEIDEAIDFLGGYTGVSSTPEYATVTIIGLKEHILEIMEIVVDAILNAQFPAKEINQTIQTKKKKLAVGLEKVSVQAKRKFNQTLFSHSPYGSLIEMEDFDDVDEKAIQNFHHHHFLKGLDFISIVGNIDDEFLQKMEAIALRFSHSKLSTPEYDYSNTPTFIHQEKEGAVQTAIRIGQVLFNKKHPDFIDFSVLNTILGGYFGSRLMSSIREDKGYTYGIGSGVLQFQETGCFFIATEVNKQYKDATIAAIQTEINQLQNELISAEELTLVQNYITGQILEASDGAAKMMSRFLSTYRFGMDLSYYDQLIQGVQQITPERLQSLAQQYLDWKKLTVVTVG